jgi:hypothetical protein
VNFRSRDFSLYPSLICELGSTFAFNELTGGFALNWAASEDKIYSMRFFYGAAAKIGLYESVGENWRASGMEIQMKKYFGSSRYSGMEYSAGISNYRGIGNTTDDYFLPRLHIGWFFMVI